MYVHGVFKLVNAVSLIGRVVGEPELRMNRAGEEECRMRVAVPRRQRNGRPDAGVVYVEVSTFGDEARLCAERLSEGSRIGLSGRLDDDPPEQGIGVLVDQLDYL
ncbi:MAG TPA: single-stranded DNA-binding protein [Thermoleophilaceae bacterium]